MTTQIRTDQLKDGLEFIKRDGSVSFINNISLGTNNINDVADPLFDTDVANKKYVDTVSGGSSGFTATEKLILELQLAFKVANASHFKELIFTSGQLTNVSIYTNSLKTTKLFNKDLTYTSGLLSQMILTRITDNKKITKNLSYDINNNLQTIDIIAS